MKILRWALIACRILAVSFGMTLFNSGCGDQGGASFVTPSEEEKKRDAETRKAMEEAASKAPTKKR